MRRPANAAMASPAAERPAPPDAKPSSHPQVPDAPAAYRVHVRSPDGSTSASLPIWIPLSIMASSAAREAAYSDVGADWGLTEEVSDNTARAAAEAVLSHGRYVEGRCAGKTDGSDRSEGECSVVDADAVRKEIRAAARRASRALLRAGGSARGAAAVEAAVKGGGALLLPSLTSRQTIRLTGGGGARTEPRTEARNEMETTRGGDVINLPPPDDREGGHEDAPKSVFEKTWLKNVLPTPATLEGSENDNRPKRVGWTETLSNTGDEYTADPWGSGTNSGEGQRKMWQDRRKGRRWGKPAGRSSERERRRRDGRRRRDESSSSYGDSDGSDSGSESTEGLLGHARDLAGEAVHEADKKLQGRMYRPVNLLPHWEGAAESVAGATADSGLFGPLLDLFLPVPRAERYGDSTVATETTATEESQAREGAGGLIAHEATWDDGAQMMAGGPDDDPIMNARSVASGKADTMGKARNMRWGSDNGAGAKLSTRSFPRRRARGTSNPVRRRNADGPSPVDRSQHSLATHAILSRNEEAEDCLRNVRDCYLPRPACLTEVQACWNRCLVDGVRLYMQQRHEAMVESDNGNGGDGGDATLAMLDRIEAELGTAASEDDSLAEVTNPTVPTSVPIPQPQKKKKSALARIKAALSRLACRKKREPVEVSYECRTDGSSDGSIAQAIEVRLPAAQFPATVDDVSQLASLNVDGRTYDDDSGIVAQ